jgi:hypothetical protein
MSVHMATAKKLDTGQAATYLLVFLVPLMLYYLTSTLMNLSPINRHALSKLLWSPPRPGLQGRSCLPRGPRKRGPRNRHLQTIDRNSIVRSRWAIKQERLTWKWRAYLFPFLWKAYQVGCCVEWGLRSVIKWLHFLRHPLLAWMAHRTIALQANQPRRATARARFDSDSFAVGVDNHASRCMGNNKHQFKNLVLARAAQGVGGISKGLAIEGKGTLVIDINDDTGKPHQVKIPNSLYLPGLKMCLLSPQHWAQEAGDDYPLPHGTRMENTAHSCVLRWGQGKFLKTILFDPSTNTPIFHTSPLTSSYWAFVNTFMACEAPFFAREHVLQFPGRCWLDGNAPPPKEFIAKENVNFNKREKHIREGVVREDDDTVRAGNIPPPPKLAPHPDLLQRNAVTFNPSPVLNEPNEYSVVAPDDQAELM